MLSQFFMLSATISPCHVYRQDGNLHVEMGEITPYALFTSILNALGKDPLSSLKRLEELIDNCRQLYEATAIVFHLDLRREQYVEVEIAHLLEESWLSLGHTPSCTLPKFVGVIWQVSP